MNIENIRMLAEIMSAGRLTKLEVTEGDLKILLERAPHSVSADTPAPRPHTPGESVNQLSERRPDALDFNNIIEVKSPIVGVFYAAPAPDAEPFVTVGSRVKKGDVLCIVEAMKLMNEIVAECDGEIADICIKSGEIAEFGQVLIKMF